MTRSVESSSPRIETIDIETAPLSVYAWGIWQENIGCNQIQTDWTILSFAVKRLGEKRIRYYDTGGRGVNRVRDDRDLLKRLWDILNAADILVTQNGKAFDVKKINARMLGAGMKPYSPVKIIDTKEVAKKHFAFTSNRLEWMGEKYASVPKHKHGKFPGFDLWEACLKDNPAAWKEMKKYNIQDVVATEKLYLVMRPWIEGHPNVATYIDNETLMCPRCSSTNLRSNGWRTTNAMLYRRYWCMDCGGWARGRNTENTKEKRRSLLVQ